MTLLFVFLIGACGSEEENDPRLLGQSNPSPTPEVLPFRATGLIWARGSWQPIGFEVRKGDRIKITSHGTWSGGQLDSQGNLQFVGAEGGNGFVKNASNQLIPGSSFQNAQCGIEPPASNVFGYCNLNGANGAKMDPNCEPEVPNGVVRIPDGNRGLCCSNRRRIQSFQRGRPSHIVDADECLPVEKNLLVMKIDSGFTPIRSFARTTILERSSRNCARPNGNPDSCNTLSYSVEDIPAGRPGATTRKFEARVKFRAAQGTRVRATLVSQSSGASVSGDSEALGNWQDLSVPELTVPANPDTVELRLTTVSDDEGFKTDWTDAQINEVGNNTNLIRNPHFAEALTNWSRYSNVRNMLQEVHKESTTMAIIDVGTKFEEEPLEVPASGVLYFRNNDLDAGIGDNQGFLTVTVERVSAP